MHRKLARDKSNYELKQKELYDFMRKARKDLDVQTGFVESLGVI